MIRAPDGAPETLAFSLPLNTKNPVDRIRPVVLCDRLRTRAEGRRPSLESAPCRFHEGHEVLDRGVELDVVGGGEDEAAVLADRAEALRDLAPHVIG